MGLRINSNLNVLTALRTLKVSDRNLGRSIERLSTGMKINRGSDNPSGLIFSERLKSQMGALSKAVENSQSANNMISVADAALQGISDLLLTLQGSIEFALNTGGASPDQIAAEQNLVDQAVEAIDRIANTTRYGNGSLLNGSAGYQVTTSTTTVPTTTGVNRAVLQNLELKSIDFADGATTRTLDITVATLPQRGEIRISGSHAALDTTIVASGFTTLRITGPRGSIDVNLASGTSTANIARGINAVAGFTGVIASAVSPSGPGAESLTIYSADFGKEELVRVEVIQGAIGVRLTTGAATTVAGAFTRRDSGALSGTGTITTASALTVGEVLFDQGRDGEVRMNGQTFTGKGVHFNIANADSFFSFDLNRDAIVESNGVLGIITDTSASFTVANTGLNFQLGELPRPTDQKALGIDSMMANALGVNVTRDVVSEAVAGRSNFVNADLDPTHNINQGGFLSTLTTGNANDLSKSPKNALFIVQDAIDKVAETRAFLGAVGAYNIQPQIDQLQVSMQNIQSSISTVRDLDYAEETAEFTRQSIIFQAGISVLANANTVPQNILALLRTGG